eukprot:11066285-Karenia_brevis.AAC.1
MMTHEEWATSIADNDQYDYDSDIASPDPASDSPRNEETVTRLEAFWHDSNEDRRMESPVLS